MLCAHAAHLDRALEATVLHHARLTAVGDTRHWLGVLARTARAQGIEALSGGKGVDE